VGFPHFGLVFGHSMDNTQLGDQKEVVIMGPAGFHFMDIFIIQTYSLFVDQNG